MGKNINLKTATYNEFTPQEEPVNGKRWSYFNVYYLEDLRNIYYLCDKYVVDSIPNLYRLCVDIGLKSRSGKAWTQRNILELVNALKNFNLISSIEGYCVSKHGLFQVINFNDELCDIEKDVFKKLFLDYCRFKEFHELFIDNREEFDASFLEVNSTPIISYSSSGKYTDHFINKSEPVVNVVAINSHNADVTRFWDVYIKWGVTLGFIKKYPLKPFGVTTTPTVKGLSVAYFIRKMPDDFSILRFVVDEMEGSYVYIPEIIYTVIFKMRFTIEDIMNKIVEECLDDSSIFKPQSTSAIFVNEKEDFLFPKIGNTYITHLLKL